MVAQRDQYHFLYDGLMAAWAAVAGTSEWALRAPSVLGATIAAGLIVVLGRRLFDRWVALASGLLFAASPFVVKWSQQARSYTLLLALSLVATLALMRALDRGTRSSWAVYGVLYSAVVVGHAVAGILLAPAHLVLIAQRRENVRPHGHWLRSSSAPSPCRGPRPSRCARPVRVPAWLGSSHRRRRWSCTRSAMFRARRGSASPWRRSVSFSCGGPGRLHLAVWLGAWALAPFALALLITAVTPVFLDRYLIVAAPAFALLAGFAIVGRDGDSGRCSRLRPSSSRRSRSFSGTPTDDGNWRGEDWRSAVAALRSESGATDVVVVPWWAHLGAEYYGASTTSAATGDSVWVLTWSETGHRLPRAERVPLGFGDHVLVEREDFGERVSLQHWVRRK